MKKALVFFWAVLTAASLASVAHADVIAGPESVIASAGVLPWALAAAVIIAVVLLLKNFRKKK